VPETVRPRIFPNPAAKQPDSKAQHVPPNSISNFMATQDRFSISRSIATFAAAIPDTPKILYLRGILRVEEFW
jgi:hypothetical protein